MNRRIAFLATLASLAANALTAPQAAAQAAAQGQAQAQAQAQALSFEVHQGGQHTLLHLRIAGRQVSGTMTEGALKLELRGQLQGRRLTAQLFMPGLSLPLAAVDGELRPDDLEVNLRSAQAAEPSRLLMRRVGAPAPAAPVGGALDSQLLGRWQQQTMTNSGGGAGGFASFTTLRTLVLAADGRVQQSMRSVGGGAGWSHRSGEELEFSGRWQTRGGEIWVLEDGQSAFVNAGRYRLVSGNMVIENAGGRQIWRR
jgi:hypothetical protein